MTDNIIFLPIDHRTKIEKVARLAITAAGDSHHAHFFGFVLRSRSVFTKTESSASLD